MKPGKTHQNKGRTLKKSIENLPSRWYCFFGSEIMLSPFELVTLQGINISHLGKRKIIFKMSFLGDMLVPWRVLLSHQIYDTCFCLNIPGDQLDSKKSPTVGPTERSDPTPEKNLSILLARLQLTERGPLGSGPIQFLMDGFLQHQQYQNTNNQAHSTNCLGFSTLCLSNFE